MEAFIVILVVWILVGLILPMEGFKSLENSGLNELVSLISIWTYVLTPFIIFYLIAKP